MFGPQILARFLEVPSEPNSVGNRWQYHPRSDRHSKVGCWGIALDLLNASALMRHHAAAAKIVLGVNHKMIDHSTGRSKKLDLVIARPEPDGKPSKASLRSLVDQYGIVLSDVETAVLAALPDVPVANVGAVLIALEAKAGMTEHQKARSRLYDELNSAHLTIHGASSQALAIAYVQTNLAKRFVSPTLNPFDLSQVPPRSSDHKQPRAVETLLDKIRELPLRSSNRDTGFDGIGITVLDFANDGGSVDLVTTPPAPQPGDRFHYAQMITRMANEYDSTFAKI